MTRTATPIAHTHCKMCDLRFHDIFVSIRERNKFKTWLHSLQEKLHSDSTTVNYSERNEAIASYLGSIEIFRRIRRRQPEAGLISINQSINRSLINWWKRKELTFG